MNPKILPKPTFINILILTLTLLLGSQLTAVPARAGDPDDLLVKSFGQGFGPNNSAVLDMTAAGVRLEKVAYQSTGKYIVVFSRDDELWVTRYHADGSRDMTFGEQNGEISVPGIGMRSLVIQPDDRILILSNNNAIGTRYLRRLTPDGLNDQSFYGLTFTHYQEDDLIALQANGHIIFANSGRDHGRFDVTYHDGTAYYRLVTTVFTPDITGIHVKDLVITADDKIIVAGSTDSTQGELVLARYLPNGEPDTSLGGTGQAVFDVAPESFDNLSQIIQADGKIVAAASAACCSYVFRVDDTGTVGRDLTFGQDGYAPAFVGDQPNCRYILNQRSKILCAGTVARPDGQNGDNLVLLGRYTASGQIDTTFAAGAGYTTLALGQNHILRDVAVGPGGRIVMLVEADEQQFLVRFRADGSLDDGGTVTTNVQANQSENIYDLVVQPDGKVVAAGQHDFVNTERMTLARYQPNGRLDPGFAGDGIYRAVIGPPIRANATTGRAVRLDPQGRLLVAGSQRRVGFDNLNFAFWRILSDGRTDLFKTFDLGEYDIAHDIALQPNGRIVLAGSTLSGDREQLVLVGLTPAGELDPNFGRQGLVIDESLAFSRFRAVAVQPDGKLVAAGSTRTAANNPRELLLARYLPDGRPDPAFGDGDGMVITPNIEGFTLTEGNTILVQPDGKILVGGFPGGNFILRYTAAGVPDTGFGTAGLALVPGALPTDLVLEEDGGILVSRQDDGFALTRLTAAGVPDETFSDDGLANLGFADGANAIARDPATGDIMLGGYGRTGRDDAVFALARVKPQSGRGGPGGGPDVIYLPLVLK